MKKPEKEKRGRKENKSWKEKLQEGGKEGKILTTQRSSSGHRQPSLRR